MTRAARPAKDNDRIRGVVARDPAQQEAIVAFLSNVQRRMRRKARRMVLAGWLAAAAAVAAILITIRSAGSFPPVMPMVTVMAILGAALLYLVVGAFWPLNLVRPSEVDRLIEGAEVYALGPILDLRYNTMRPKQWTRALTAVSDLLARVTEGDVDCLNPSQRQYLREIMAGAGRVGLRPAAHVQLQVAIIEAMARLGDAPSLPIIRRLARRAAGSPQPSAVEAAAERWRPILEAKIAKVESHRTLLRGSGVLPAGAESLLRAAGPGVAPDPAKLLRPNAPAERQNPAG